METKGTSPLIPVGPVPPRRRGRALLWPLVLAGLVVVFWAFPSVWYTRVNPGSSGVWLSEKTNAPGWRFEPRSIAKSAEATLAADAVFYGEFTGNAGEVVRLFTAKRFRENPYEVGLFVHTPDRCWTASGWQIEPAVPDHLTVPVAGMPLMVERRLFSYSGGSRELVYFFGLVGGRSLPYRLDHNLGVGVRLRRSASRADAESGLRATDRVFWRRVWESFCSRQRLFGPKEFIRISTALVGNDVARADAVLRAAVSQLLETTPYHDHDDGLGGRPKDNAGGPLPLHAGR